MAQEFTFLGRKYDTIKLQRFLQACPRIDIKVEELLSKELVDEHGLRVHYEDGGPPYGHIGLYKSHGGYVVIYGLKQVETILGKGAKKLQGFLVSKPLLKKIQAEDNIAAASTVVCTNNRPEPRGVMENAFNRAETRRPSDGVNRVTGRWR